MPNNNGFGEIHVAFYCQDGMNAAKGTNTRERPRRYGSTPPSNHTGASVMFIFKTDSIMDMNVTDGAILSSNIDT